MHKTFHIHKVSLSIRILIRASLAASSCNPYIHMVPIQLTVYCIHVTIQCIFKLNEYVLSSHQNIKTLLKHPGIVRTLNYIQWQSTNVTKYRAARALVCLKKKNFKRLPPHSALRLPQLIRTQAQINTSNTFVQGNVLSKRRLFDQCIKVSSIVVHKHPLKILSLCRGSCKSVSEEQAYAISSVCKVNE